MIDSISGTNKPTTPQGIHDMHSSEKAVAEEAVSKADRNSLSRKVSKGALWVTAASLSARILNIISAIILSRLMVPSDFGLFSIATAIITFSQGTTQTGFESALIQKQDRAEDYLNIAWTFELIRNLLLFLIIFLAAPQLSSFFKEPRAVDILRVLSLSLVLQGLRNIGVVYFRKEFNFDKQFVLEILPQAVYISVVIFLGFALRNVWAMILAYLASNLVACLLSYIMHRYRPRLDINLKKVKNLFHFGKWILGTSILSMIMGQGTSMFIGRFFGMATLGLYNRADTFSNMVFIQINEVVWKVGYPAYSKLHVDTTRLKNAYLRTLQLLAAFGMPVAGGLLVLSNNFVHLFLTDKWLSIVLIMQIFCLQAAFGLLNTPALVALQASGRPSSVAKITFLTVIIAASLVYPLSSRWGITGAMMALFLSVAISSPLIWYAANKMMNCSFLDFVKSIVFSLISTVVMSLAIIALKYCVIAQVGHFEFFELIFIGACIYAITTLFFDKFSNYELCGLLKQKIFLRQ